MPNQARRITTTDPSSLTLIALAAMASLNAHAQTAPAPSESAAPQLQEVVITAQKRTERLKDTPVAASVMSADALEKANATDISDINNLVPSVQLKGSFNGRVPYAMRGISTNANEGTIGLTSGVSIMIDGVPVPSDSTAANELQDIRRVEVLKGPQATLGGRTASAGVINFVTQSPSKTFKGNVGLTATDDNELRGNVFVSGPINEMLAYSASLNASKREYPIHNTMTGQNSQSESQNGRFKLQLSPDSTLDITLAARLAEGKSTGSTFTYQYLTPGAQLFPYFPWNAGSGVSQAVALPGITPHYGNTDYASPVDMRSKTRDRDFSLNIEKRIDDWTFTSTTARQSNKQNNVQDVPVVATYFLNDLRQPAIPDPANGGPPYFYNQQNLVINPTSLSQEFKVASPLNRPVSFVAGVFYSDVNVSLETNRTMFVNPKIDRITSSTKSLGLYGRATWNLSNDTSLLTGLRGNRDMISYSINNLANGAASSGSTDSNVLVGDITLRQKLGKDQMVYGTFAKGYKPKAYNTAQTLDPAVPASMDVRPVDQERIRHFELGAKSTLLGGALNLNAALFRTEYTDYQVQIFANDSSGYVNVLKLANAAKARTQGLELDAVAAAGANTRINASAAFIDAKLLEFTEAPCYHGQVEGCTAVAGTDGQQNLSGKSMPDAPKVKLTLGLEHHLQQEFTPWDLRLNAQYAYRTSAYLQANHNPYTRQGSFGIFNIGAGMSSPDDKYNISFFVNNVFNKFYLTNAEDFFSGLWGGGANAVIGQPARDARRYAGVRLQVKFD